MSVPIEHVIALSALLFTVGAVGALVRRNVLVVLLCLELMLNAANLALIGFNRVHAHDPLTAASSLDGQVLALMVVAVAAAEVAVALGMVVAVVRNRDSLDLDEASLLEW